ncbi:RNA polymerase sigma factor [Marinoscillum sp. 108]|uniref:RNA polymerase sigma factor n=1 Tax=Marinoscillum sp. 108 TaxID=2653151 RepID=UPI0012F2C156|nr:RNA polymerase sigma-70 factor [Marinoscillum sp. 108]VXD14080.1 RNA polymerase sigma-70 factor (ECF subfamily) [Marinoscillum sp. 108]
MAFSVKFGSDSELVTRLRDGDEYAYSKLYEKYASKIYNISRKMGLLHEDAEGVVQDVFMKIWRNRENLDSSLSFNAYIISIVRSIVFKQSRKRARFLAFQHYAITYWPGESNETEEYVIFSDLDELSSKAIDELPTKQKQVFMMKNFEHLTNEEIAERLKLSTRTVENQIYRATKSLREKLIEMKVVAPGVVGLIFML